MLLFISLLLNFKCNSFPFSPSINILSCILFLIFWLSFSSKEEKHWQRQGSISPLIVSRIKLTEFSCHQIIMTSCSRFPRFRVSNNFYKSWIISHRLAHVTVATYLSIPRPRSRMGCNWMKITLPQFPSTCKKIPLQSKNRLAVNMVVELWEACHVIALYLFLASSVGRGIRVLAWCPIMTRALDFRELARRTERRVFPGFFHALRLLQELLLPFPAAEWSILHRDYWMVSISFSSNYLWQE